MQDWGTYCIEMSVLMSTMFKQQSNFADRHMTAPARLCTHSQLPTYASSGKLKLAVSGHSSSRYHYMPCAQSAFTH